MPKEVSSASAPGSVETNPPQVARRQLLLYAGDTWGSFKDHASPDRQSPVVSCARRNICSARAGGHRCAPACLLSSQGASLPRFRGFGVRSTRCPLRFLLQSRLLPRGHNATMGKSTTLDRLNFRPQRRCSRRRVASESSRQNRLRIAIDARPSCLLNLST